MAFPVGMYIQNSQSHSMVTFSDDLEMEESEAIVETNKKVRKYIADDIADCILSKLPLKSLKRFECVSKSWSLLLQNSYFINMFNKNNNLTCISKDYDDAYFILQYIKDENKIPSEFYLLPNNVFENRVKIDWPHPYREYNEHIYIMGSVSINGIFCLKQSFNGIPVLWNPTTGESKIIPRSRLESAPPSQGTRYIIHGFGYDSVTDDYKVVQLIHYHLLNNEYKSSWQLYSLRNKSWKELDTGTQKDHYYTKYRGIGVYVNGVSHWWARTVYESDDEVEECLVSFDFSNEVLFTTPAPSYLDVTPRPLSVEPWKKHPEKFLEKHLVLLNDSVALISTYRETSTLHISILGELGVRESWTKLFVINQVPFIKHPIGVGTKNNILFFKKTDGKLACIDLNTKVIEDDLGVDSWSFGCQIGKYKKSFLLIPGMNN